jgi:hypothetical protein
MEHSNYPHIGDGDLYDCPACDALMAERCESFCADNGGQCPVCGDAMDYCQGHGETGDPIGFAILTAHDRGDHSTCIVWKE